MFRLVVHHLRRRGLLSSLQQAWDIVRTGGLAQLFRKLAFAQRRARDEKLFWSKYSSPQEELRRWHGQAKEWFRSNGRRVLIVVPSYRDHELLEGLLAGLQTHTPAGTYRVVISDDHSDEPRHLAALQAIAAAGRAEIVYGDRNVGFAANCNRGMAVAEDDEDVVLVNSDVVPRALWLESLQYSLAMDPADIICPKLIYADGTIQYAGGYRNLTSPNWFDHLFRFKQVDHPPSTVRMPTFFATGAVLYIVAAARRRLGMLDEQFGMAFEDVDYSLRCWQTGGSVAVEPRSLLEHRESATRGQVQGVRELNSQAYFWTKNQAFFDRRLTTGSAKRRIIFVTQDVGLGGGHRVIFHHLNTLAKAGHSCELWNLVGRPDWYALHPDISVRAFSSYAALIERLKDIDAIKVATWWETAEPVWLSSVNRGIPAYLVQDIESSYYKDSPLMQARALASYRPEFNYLTNTGPLRDQLTNLFGYEATDVGLGFDSDIFVPRPVQRDNSTVLIAVRGEPLKNFAYAREIAKRLQRQGWRVLAFGMDRSVLGDLTVDEFHSKPSDEQLSELYSRSTIFLSTSTHEGFALPPIEAMACGCAVATTDAVGNREYINDTNVVLIPHKDAATATQQIIDTCNGRHRLERLREAGYQTAARYAWERVDNRLLAAFDAIAASEYAKPAYLDKRTTEQLETGNG
jgi:GT2 family glycosyltransferase